MLIYLINRNKFEENINSIYKFLEYLGGGDG